MIQGKKQVDSIGLSIQEKERGLGFSCPQWQGLILESLAPLVCIDGKILLPCGMKTERKSKDDLVCVRFDFEGGFHMELVFNLAAAGIIHLKSSITNASGKAVVLNRVNVLQTKGNVKFGTDARRIRILEQTYITGSVSPLAVSGVKGKKAKASKKELAHRVSTTCWLAYDSSDKQAFLVGYETSERWMGQIGMQVQSSGVVKEWYAGFDGGDLIFDAHESLTLEEIVFMQGTDPMVLLESYADRVKQRFNVPILKESLVSWCSWYPYRLGVTQERILENARVAAERLKPLGLSIMEADLGWEKDQLPSTFEENDQFSKGLKWLSEQLHKLGFKLGAWKAPYSISEFDPLVKEHPEWLIKDKNGKPAVLYTWYWEPHGKVFILDITHPGAQQWLREKIRSLGERGVRYLKADFIGCVRDERAKQRHNRKIVSGGGYEAGRICAEIIRESLRSVQPDAILLCISGAELPGQGMWPLLYSCNDTGNTGYISWDFHRDNYHAVATHLFKNRRWGIIQPSCLCVGLPGTLEEARVRATAAFLAGGQIDISDNLLNLPEDRWQVLEATLPPLGITARPIDLFEPLISAVSTYEEVAVTGKQEEKTVTQEHKPGSVWHVHVKKDWDEWDLIGIFNLQEPSKDKSDKTGSTQQISKFTIPLEKFGLNPRDKYWGYEFWSGQFLGVIPGAHKNPRGYIHPGDSQALTAGDTPGVLDIAFFGPGVKLICLRKIRSHPWVAGTSFHQSAGAELKNVKWDEDKGELRGQLHRPIVQQGFVSIAGVDHHEVIAEVGGKRVSVRLGSMGSVLMPIVAQGKDIDWLVKIVKSA